MLTFEFRRIGRDSAVMTGWRERLCRCTQIIKVRADNEVRADNKVHADRRVHAD